MAEKQENFDASLYMGSSEFMSAKRAPDEGWARLTITEIAAEEITNRQSGKAHKKAVLSFEEVDLRLPLNSTNLAVLIQAWGKGVAKWVGQQIRIKKELVRFGAEMVPGLIVYALKENPAHLAAQAEAEADQIPF